MSGLLAVALALSHVRARADDSAQGPIYVEGTVGISYSDFPNLLTLGAFTRGYSWTGFWPALEVGWHPTGRHDGFVVGLRQAFVITELDYTGGHAAGTTVARLGYDLAFKAGSLEINVDPFATVGIGYIFDGLTGVSGPSAGITTTGGIDVKLFLAKGYYVLVRPGELGLQSIHDYGKCAFTYAAAAGAGLAFGK